MDSGAYAGIRIEQTAKDFRIGSEKLAYHPVAANEPGKFREITSDDE
jgi:hypothetical protein